MKDKSEYQVYLDELKAQVADLEAKLEAIHNWVLNTCPDEYNRFVKETN